MVIFFAEGRFFRDILRSLLPNGLYSGYVIDEYIECIRSTLSDRCVVLTTMLWAQIWFCDGRLSSEWLRANIVVTSRCDSIIVPVFLNMHWFVVRFLFRDNTVCLYEPLFKSRSSSLYTTTSSSIFPGAPTNMAEVLY